MDEDFLRGRKPAVANDIVTRLLAQIDADHLADVWQLLCDTREEIEQLQRLGDTMAYCVRAGDGTEMFAAVHAWQEFRRG